MEKLFMWVPLIISILTFIGIIINVWNSQRSIKIGKDTHTLFNSRMDEMLELTKKSAHAEGVKEESDAAAAQNAVAQTTATTAAAAAVASEIVAGALAQKVDKVVKSDVTTVTNFNKPRKILSQTKPKPKSRK